MVVSRPTLAVLGVTAILSLAAPAAASGPALNAPQAELDRSLVCPVDPAGATVTPLMFVTGTGASGDLAWVLVGNAFRALGHPVCYVNFPDSTTADIQVSVEYLVHGLRRMYAISGRKAAVLGISQGGLLPRFALTYWPDLRRKVGDVLAAAGTQHGTTVTFGCSATSPCSPAHWQQIRGSKLLRALDRQPDETPGAVSYTTIRTLTDETVQPQAGRQPASSLEGARNILIQDVCPARATTHRGALVDSVTFAAFTDAITHDGRERRGAAAIARLPADVCEHPYAPGLDPLTTEAFLGVSGLFVGQAPPNAVPAEPPVRPVFKRRRAPLQ